VNLTHDIKKFIYLIIRIKVFNIPLLFLINILKPLIKLNKKSRLIKFPVNKKIKIFLSDSKYFYLWNDGGNQIGSIIYWLGFYGYEPETIKLFRYLLKYCNTFFDIGANTGLFSIIASKDNPNTRTYAFEPIDQNYNYILKNIEVNNIRYIFPICCAVSNTDGEISFNLQNTIVSPQGASERSELENIYRTIKVKSVKLDTFINEYQIDSVDLIKMDTEGTEHKILEGSIEIIKRDRPIIISEVLPEITENHIHNILDKFNYSYYHITLEGLIKKNKIKGDNTLKYQNYLFIPEDKLQVLNNFKITD